MAFSELTEDCILHILLSVRDTIRIRPLLCTSKVFGVVWSEYASLIEWSSESGVDDLFPARRYSSYVLSTRQVKALEWLFTKSMSWLQLPMSFGKTAVQLIYCVEKVRTLGGYAFAIFTQKVASTAYEEVVKIFGESRCYRGVSIVSKDNTWYGTEYEDNTVYVMCRNGFKPKHRPHTCNPCAVTVDECHTEPKYVSDVVDAYKECCNVALFTAASTRVVMSNGSQIVTTHNFARDVAFDYYGDTTLIGMDLPSVQYKVASLERGPFFVTVSDELAKATMVDIDQRVYDYIEDMTPYRTPYDYDIVEPYHKKWELSNKEEFAPPRDMAILKKAVDELLSLDDGSVFVMIGELKRGVVDIDYKNLVANFLMGEVGTSNMDIGSRKRRVIVGTTAAFSEGINIPKINKVVLFKIGESVEMIRQAVGRFRRITSKEDIVYVTIICEKYAASLLSMVPSDIVDDYMRERNTKKLSVVIDGRLLTPDLSLVEMVAVGYKTNSKTITSEWLLEYGTTNFKVNDRGDIARKTTAAWVDNPNGLLACAHTFIVSDDSSATCVCLVKRNGIKARIESLTSLPRVKIQVNDEVISKVRATSVQGRGGVCTVDYLKEVCGALGLKKAGKKAEIVKRILDHVDKK